MTNNPEIEMNRLALTTIRWISLLAIAFSGGVHLSIVPVEFSHSVAHGSFFLVVGLAQASWAVAFWRFPARVWSCIGLGLSGGIAVLWLLTQLVSVPYAATAEPIDIWLILTKMAEINGFVALVGYQAMGNPDGPPEPLISWTVIGAVTLAIGFGILIWGAGHLAETAVPPFGYGVPIEDRLPHRLPDQPSLEGRRAIYVGADRASRRNVRVLELDESKALFANSSEPIGFWSWPAWTWGTGARGQVDLATHMGGRSPLHSLDRSPHRWSHI